MGAHIEQEGRVKVLYRGGVFFVTVAVRRESGYLADEIKGRFATEPAAELYAKTLLPRIREVCCGE
jgi:hypothetical protein